jgi:hypothetical protein
VLGDEKYLKHKFLHSIKVMELKVLMIFSLLLGIIAKDFSYSVYSDLDYSDVTPKPLNNKNYNEVLGSFEFVFIMFYTDW